MSTAAFFPSFSCRSKENARFSEWKLLGLRQRDEIHVPRPRFFSSGSALFFFSRFFSEDVWVERDMRLNGPRYWMAVWNVTVVGRQMVFFIKFSRQFEHACDIQSPSFWLEICSSLFIKIGRIRIRIFILRILYCNLLICNSQLPSPFSIQFPISSDGSFVIFKRGGNYKWFLIIIIKYNPSIDVPYANEKWNTTLYVCTCALRVKHRLRGSSSPFRVSAFNTRSRTTFFALTLSRRE